MRDHFLLWFFIYFCPLFFASCTQYAARIIPFPPLLLLFYISLSFFFSLSHVFTHLNFSLHTKLCFTTEKKTLLFPSLYFNYLPWGFFVCCFTLSINYHQFLFTILNCKYTRFYNTKYDT